MIFWKFKKGLEVIFINPYRENWRKGKFIQNIVINELYLKWESMEAIKYGFLIPTISLFFLVKKVHREISIVKCQFCDNILNFKGFLPNNLSSSSSLNLSVKNYK